MQEQCCFNPAQVRTVRDARRQAARLVSDYYCVAPREWRLMPYEVKTLRRLTRLEVTDNALAQTVCYNVRRTAESLVIQDGDLYRICLQDHRILHAARRNPLSLRSLLTYVLTHELVHVVRFGQQLQRFDLPADLRLEEERKVERTTRTILATGGPAELRSFVANATNLVC